MSDQELDCAEEGGGWVFLQDVEITLLRDGGEVVTSKGSCG